MNYAPFENRWEFMHHYDGIPPMSGYRSPECVMWLKEKKTNFFHMVTEIKDEGVVVGSRKLKLWGTIVLNGTTSWSELYENYTFLNNSPCGKKV